MSSSSELITCYCMSYGDYEGKLGHPLNEKKCNQNAKRIHSKFIERKPTRWERFVRTIKCCPYDHLLYQENHNTVHVYFKDRIVVFEF